MHGRPDLIMTEFLSVEGICHGARSALLGLVYHDSERPIVAQLYGPHPASFYHVAQLVCELGFDGLDINMGCPSKKVAALGSGAALINDPARAIAIIKAARSGIERWAGGAPLSITQLYPALSGWLDRFKAGGTQKPVYRRNPIPVSVKTRIGVEKIVIKEWIPRLLEASPEAISIHGRTLRQGYRGEADWVSIAEAVEIARDSDTLILGNGDLKSLNDAVIRVRQTGVDGVLIGRAAMGNPWIFNRKEIARAFSNRTHWDDTEKSARLIQMPPITRQTLFSVALQHARLFEAMHGRAYFNGVRKHLGAYCRGFKGARSLRAEMVRADHADNVAQLIKSHLTKSPLLREVESDARHAN